MRKQSFLLFISMIITVFCLAAVYSDSSHFLIGINKNGAPYANANFEVEIREAATVITKTILTTNNRGQLFVSVSSGTWYINVACKTFIENKIADSDTFVSTRNYSKFCNYMPLIDPSVSFNTLLDVPSLITKSITIREVQ